MVVTGYGQQRRSDLTGAIASVTPNVDQTPVLSLEQTLQGAAPGVMVTQASSAPGGALSIRVRGGSSVTGNNEPLYVIDGFPVENDPESQNPSDGGREADDHRSVESTRGAQSERHRVDRDSQGRIGDVDLRRARRERRHHHHDEARSDGASSLHTRFVQRNAECRASLQSSQLAAVREVRQRVVGEQRDGRHLHRSRFPAQHRLAVADFPQRSVEQHSGRRHGRRQRPERDALRALRRRVQSGRCRRQLRIQAHLAARQSRSEHRRQIPLGKHGDLEPSEQPLDPD